MRIRFAGFGGQGVVLCGFVFGKAAMFEGKNAIHTQSYGSASRGGLTKSDVGIEEGEIYDLACSELDILITLSQQSYDKYSPELQQGGVLFYESDLVEVATQEAVESYGAGVTDLAFKKFGRKIMANMIMMGLVNEICGVVGSVALERTVRESVPPGTEDNNVLALAEGARLAKQLTGKAG